MRGGGAGGGSKKEPEGEEGMGDSMCTFRIRPQEITHGAIMRHLLLSIYCSDLIQCSDGWRNATMDTENLASE